MKKLASLIKGYVEWSTKRRSNVIAAFAIMGILAYQFYFIWTLITNNGMKVNSIMDIIEINPAVTLVSAFLILVELATAFWKARVLVSDHSLTITMYYLCHLSLLVTLVSFAVGAFVKSSYVLFAVYAFFFVSTLLSLILSFFDND